MKVNLYRYLLNLRAMEFIGNLERDLSSLPPGVLDYNGQIYKFQEGSIPGLKGVGLIVVAVRDGIQYQGWRGSLDNICMRQVNGVSFVNEVKVDDLVRKMKEI